MDEEEFEPDRGFVHPEHGRRNQTEDQRQRELERGRARRRNQTEDERQRELERGRARRRNQTEDERQRELERSRARRRNQTEDERQRELGPETEDQRPLELELRQAEEEHLRRRDHERERRRRRREAPHANFRAAIVGTDFEQAPARHNLGAMVKICAFGCEALHFEAEPARLLHNCCHKGKALAPPLSPYPDVLKELLTGNSNESKNFREFIRQYNIAHAFASFGAKIEALPPGRGPFCFKISGEVYHLATSALVRNQPDGPSPAPRYGQIYIYDADTAVRYRMHIQQNEHCHDSIMRKIDEEMRNVNPYVEQYRNLHTATENAEAIARQRGLQPIHMELRLIRNPRDDQRRYNAPVTNRECMYLIQSGEGEIRDLDLAVHPFDDRGCVRISSVSRHVDPMVFPLLFPRGDSGWCINAPNAVDGPKRPTPLQFYSSRISVRGDFNPIHHAGKLFQQFLVHAYCRVEAERLSFLKKNQKQLRTEAYQGLIDYLANAAVERNLRPGNLVILPATFIGGPRYMRQKYLDAMTIVRRFGRPVYFITFTCNPRWPEISAVLEPYRDRPDMAARVFMLKVEHFLQIMTKHHILGKVIAYVYVIEFQKRGLPHVHSLFWMHEDDHLLNGDDVDRVISAEIPDKQEDPELYDIVMRNNIHGPCGVHDVQCEPTCRDHNPACPCMENDVCKKRFPKPFQEDTDITGDSYPKYRRRDNRQENHRVRNGRIHNGLVVPYNAYITKTFDAHINVEMCHTITAIKYLCKYFMKGHDRARAGFLEDAEGRLELNEIKEFVDTRCVTPPEAMWRVLENPLHDHSHTIIQLTVHLENGQQIFFEEGEEEEALRRASTKDTTLTAWFKLNQSDPDARQHLYHDIPPRYVWNVAKKMWQKRRNSLVDGKDDSVIARIGAVSPRQIELYHLRLLLLNVPGATSFQDLRTVGGMVFDTFKQAAFARGLIIDDLEWARCMEESALYMMPYQLRSLFALLLVHCEVINANDLWMQFRLAMTEDFRHRGYDEQTADSMALLEIQAELEASGSNCSDKGLPVPGPLPENIEDAFDNAIIYSARGQEMLDMLNEAQRTAADAILDALHSPQPTGHRCFYIDGPGGTGKTFLYTTLINILLGEGKRVIAVAWTGIAAILLPRGRTCHTAFRLPLDLQPDSVCKLTMKEKEALRDVDMIVWDEASMADKRALEMVDKALQDVMQNDVPFGGKVIALGGDFRQVLPVVPGGSQGQIIAKCVKSSDLWRHFRQLPLRVNMRADANEIEYAEWLLQLGNGTLPPPVRNQKTPYSIVLPARCITRNVVDDLFPDLFDGANEEMQQRVILTPFNEDCRLSNEQILNRMSGDKVTLKSIDTVGVEEGQDEAAAQQNYPVEFLNSVQLAGLPPHELNLKRNCIVMLLRNMSIFKGLCNGTRLRVLDIKPTILKVQILSGAHRGTVHFIPRVTLDTKDAKDLPFNLRRRKFPVKLGYSMTINKAQGQTLDKVGVFLRSPVFTHGQLYVACSRVRSMEALRIQVVDGLRQGSSEGETVTDNIVFKEVL